jgi:putative transposase
MVWDKKIAVNNFMYINPTKYRNKYRIETARLRNYDYSANGAYFVTICTKDKHNYFGEITNSKMVLSKIGNVARNELIKTPKIRDDVVLDQFVVMPNHVHAIIIIDNNLTHKPIMIETRGVASLPEPNDEYPTATGFWQPNKFGPQSRNLPSIIRGYKSAVTTYAVKNGINFAWQTRYHDHVIRNEKEMIRIQEYIYNNVRNWGRDCFYK